MTIKAIRKYNIDATGNACAGDTILFSESVFGGSYRKPVHLGTRRIAAKIVRDNYGLDKQQHTFFLHVIGSDGYNKLRTGENIRRKGRNVYRIKIMRMTWDDESTRDIALSEKHERGDRARRARDLRKAM